MCARRGMFMLEAVFLTTCQTVFSEMPHSHGLPALQTQRNNGQLSIPAAVNHQSIASFTQFGTGTVGGGLRLWMLYSCPLQVLQRSEERRVGKECRSRRSAY